MEKILFRLIFKHTPILGVSILLSMFIVDWLNVDDNWLLKLLIFALIEVYIYWRATDKPPTSEILAVILICLVLCFFAPPYLDTKGKGHELKFTYNGNSPAQIVYVLNSCDSKKYYAHKIPFGMAQKGPNEFLIRASDLAMQHIDSDCVKVTFSLIQNGQEERNLGEFVFSSVK